MSQILHAQVPPPIGLLAELTHACPLGCPYCSNPVFLEGRAAELDTAEWRRVLSQAADLGVLQVHLSGGEPAARRDLLDIVAHCASVGLYSNLITSGIGLTERRIASLKEAGLDHLQLSMQDTQAESADRIANYRGAFDRKMRVAQWTVAVDLPLTVNVVLHRANVHRAREMVDMAVAMGAGRVEVAHAQYYGWALKNRDQLLPPRAAAEAAVAAIEEMKPQYEGTIAIDHVVPDYYAKYPKPCMGGWGRGILNVTPSGKVLPCHAAETIPGLEFWSVREHALANIWHHSPAFNAYRGTSWMKEPCRSCDRRDKDFGGCRCQALAITGDAAATDPVCVLSPHHGLMKPLTPEADKEKGKGAEAPYDYRRLERT